MRGCRYCETRLNEAMSRGRPAEARCVLHEAQIAGPRGGPLLVSEERAFKAASVLDLVHYQVSGIQGAFVDVRAGVRIS